MRSTGLTKPQKSYPKEMAVPLHVGPVFRRSVLGSFWILLVTTLGGIFYWSSSSPARTQMCHALTWGHVHYRTAGAIATRELMLTGIVLLTLVPVLRMVLVLISFLKSRDWLYAVLTAGVLATILFGLIQSLA